MQPRYRISVNTGWRRRQHHSQMQEQHESKKDNETNHTRSRPRVLDRQEAKSHRRLTLASSVAENMIQVLLQLVFEIVRFHYLVTVFAIASQCVFVCASHNQSLDHADRLVHVDLKHSSVKSCVPKFVPKLQVLLMS